MAYRAYYLAGDPWQGNGKKFLKKAAKFAIGAAKSLVLPGQPSLISRVTGSAGKTVQTTYHATLPGFDHGGGRRHRRMNVTNVRALRRSIRRMKGFEKLARSVITFSTGRKPKKGRFVAKRRKS